MTRKEFTKIIELLGATVKESVTTSVDYLVVGISPGGRKLSDALRFGVEVITYIDFLNILGNPINWLQSIKN